MTKLPLTLLKYSQNSMNDIKANHGLQLVHSVMKGFFPQRTKVCRIPEAKPTL